MTSKVTSCRNKQRLHKLESSSIFRNYAFRIRQGCNECFRITQCKVPFTTRILQYKIKEYLELTLNLIISLIQAG